MDAKLQKSFDIFKKYGWENVTAENVLELSIGTPEEQKIALNGLKSGGWGETLQKGDDYFYRKYFSDLSIEAKLVLFAIRVGVTAARASNIINFSHINYEAFFKVVAERGAKFASDLIVSLSSGDAFNGVFHMYFYANQLMRFINELNLPVPQNENYLLGWTASVAESLGLESPLSFYDKRDNTELDIFKKTFAEHIKTGVALNISASGVNDFANVIAAGAKQGLIPRDEAIELIFSALDSAIRPSDRAAWVSALEELGVPNEEYINRIQFLIPVLSTGDNAIVSKIAPILIEHASLEFLTEVLLASFSCNTKKAKKMLLKAALQREKPPNAQDLSSWLFVFAADSDKTIASLSKKLSEKWAIEAEEIEAEDTAVMGLWKETPPVWEVPDFEVGEVSPEILTELAAEILARPIDNVGWGDVIHDVLVERFLAAINIVALKDKQKARDALCGLNTRSDTRLIIKIAHWAKGINNTPYFFNNAPAYQVPLTARNYIVSLKFGEVPCLLSTPSKMDLTITVSDLVSRLNLYEEKKVDALEADLFLALTRLDVKTEKTEHREQLKNIKILIRLKSDEPIKNLTAGQAVINYLENTIPEKKMILDKNHDDYDINRNKIGKAFDGFPPRISANYQFQDFSTFPWMGDGVLHDICWLPNTAQHDMGLIMRQVARRKAPFSPAVAINFLAVMRSPSQQAANDSALAIQEAWERGLLRPNIPDVKYLDWTTNPPSNLAALASALESIARDGVLSVVWYVLDDLIGASLAAPKMLTGTAQVAEAILSLLPEVQYAVENKIAPSSALDLPNTIELATRKGSSQAVSTAKKIAELLNE